VILLWNRVRKTSVINEIVFHRFMCFELGEDLSDGSFFFVVKFVSIQTHFFQKKMQMKQAFCYQDSHKDRYSWWNVASQRNIKEKKQIFSCILTRSSCLHREWLLKIFNDTCEYMNTSESCNYSMLRQVKSLINKLEFHSSMNNSYFLC
jgi:hypothetical protein